jgi:hypothetical protein
MTCEDDTAAIAGPAPRTGKRRSRSEATGRTVAAYRAGADSRAGLMLSPAFAAAFEAAKERIRAMEYRYVEEESQNRQALIYCAVVLETPYNDFATH